MHKSHEILHKSPENDVRLCGGGAYQAAQGKDFPMHQHALWELVYYRTGNIVCPIGGKDYNAQPGTVLITPPNTPHAEYARTAYSNYYLSIDAPRDRDWPIVCFDDADGSLARVCRAAVRELRTQGTDRHLMLNLLAAELDLLVRRASSATEMTDHEHLVAEVEEFLQQAVASPRPLREIARDVGASESAIRAAFAEIRGCSPTQHRQQLRLRHAVAMLQGSSLTLDAIADLCGYYSASHLSRHIKSQTGKSPGQLRN